MPVRMLKTTQEYMDSAHIMSIAFTSKNSDTEEEFAAQCQKQLDDDAHDYWGYFNHDGKMLATFINHRHDVIFDGHSVLSGGIGGVASLPAGRTKGNVRAIFVSVMEDMLQRGFVFSMLYPFSHVYYRKFGYELIQTRAMNTVETRQFTQYKLSMNVSMIDKDDCILPLKEIHEKFIARYNLGYHRLKESQWDFAKSDPYKETKYSYVLSDHAGAHAYVVFNTVREDGDNILNVVDMAYDSKDALHNLFAFFARMGPHYKKARFALPNDVELGALIDEPWEIEATKNQFGMARVVNVEAALKLMKHPEQPGSYTIRVIDDFLPLNDATFRVEFGAGETCVTKTTDVPDITVNVAALSQLLTGFVSLYTASFRRDVELHDNAETLNRVFTQKPLYFNDPF